MQKSIRLINLGAFCFLTGILFFAYHRHIIIFNIPTFRKLAIKPTEQSVPVLKKKMKIFFWYQEEWRREDVGLLEYDDIAKTLQCLVSAWLNVLDDHNLNQKQLSVQSVAFSIQHEALISFDRNPFCKESSTFSKWMWMESLLKTIRENIPMVQAVYFLVHHQPLNDYHLDFSRAWPICGFRQSH